MAIGAVCGRLEPDGVAKKKLYIMTLGVLAPYRECGIGSQALTMIIETASKRGDISEIFMHVQTNNEDAHKFYKKFNFVITSTVDKYYQRIEPTSANVLTLVLA